MTVVVVTDSAAGLPTDLRDGVDEVTDDIYQRERASTAGATPAELLTAYQRALADSGEDGVVAIHISSALSGTFGAAEHAATDLGGPVRVVDSRSAAMGAGFVALAAARAAAGGADLETVVAAADSAVRRGHAYIVVRRLDNLRRSGRIGSAAARLGTALSLKPLLRIDDGKLVLAQRVRTASKAVATMIERVCEVVGSRPASIAVHHVANPGGAAEVAAILAERLPVCEPAVVTDLGPVLALHVGGGALAVCVDISEEDSR